MAGSAVGGRAVLVDFAGRRLRAMVVLVVFLTLLLAGVAALTIHGVEEKLDSGARCRLESTWVVECTSGEGRYTAHVGIPVVAAVNLLVAAYLAWEASRLGVAVVDPQGLVVVNLRGCRVFIPRQERLEIGLVESGLWSLWRLEAVFPGGCRLPLLHGDIARLAAAVEGMWGARLVVRPAHAVAGL